MGQQLPFTQPQQPAWPQPGLGQSGVPGNATGGNPLAPSALSMDPKLRAQVQAQLQNPNGGDHYQGAPQAPPPAANAMSPQQAALLNALGAGGGPNLPPAGMPGAETPPPFENPLMPGSPQDMLLGGAAGVGIGLGLNKFAEAAGPTKLAKLLDRLPGMKSLNGLLDRHVLTAPQLTRQPWFQEMFLTHAQGAASPQAAAQNVLKHMEARHIRQVLAPYAKNPDIIKRLGHHRSFEKFLHAAETELKALATQSGKDGQALRKTLNGLKNQISGKKSLYAPLLENQAKLAHQLEKQGVGPVGRAFASMYNYTHRVFGGELVKDGLPGAMKRNGVAAKMLGPLLMGVMLLGQSFAKARKAQDGEKVKTFFHDFLGIGLGNFIGWEMGRKILGSTGIVQKALGSWARKAPFKLLSFLPLVGKFLGRVTLAGFATEMIAMFAVGSLFQKGFEKIAHRIFGKPSRASIEGTAQNAQANTHSDTPLQRSKRMDKLFRNPEANKPLSSLSPDDIRTNAAAAQQAKIEEMVMGMPWDPNNMFNPTRSH